MPRPRSLMVGTETRDDAAVWKLDARRGLVATLAVFAPVVDDPRDYGYIAAAHARTDVTGFGLLGHLDSMMTGSKARAHLDAAALLLLPGVRELAREGVVPGGTRANLTWVSERATFPEQMSEPDRLVLADAQT